MGLTADIVESWRHPRRVLRRHLDHPRSEPLLFIFLFTFLLLAFVGQWPVAARAAFVQPEVPLSQRLLAAGLGLLATIPMWYGLAALSHLAARALRGQGDWYKARAALFWALATVGPFMLLQGLVTGLIGPGAQAMQTGAVVGVIFVVYWIVMLIEAERVEAERE